MQWAAQSRLRPRELGHSFRLFVEEFCELSRRKQQEPPAAPQPFIAFSM
jgi:hypothetical protein